MADFFRRIGHPWIAFAHDTFMAAASFLISLYLRLGDGAFSYAREFLLEGMAIFTVVSAGVFLSMRLYRGIWRYASLNDLVAITRAVTLVILIFTPLMFMLTRLDALPRSILLINWFVLMALLGGPRFLYRLIKDRRFDRFLERDGYRRVPVLLVGTGEGTEMFIRATDHEAGAAYRVVGIVDEKGTRVGRNIRGVPILGTPENLPETVERLTRRGERPQRLILTRQNLDGARISEILNIADGLGMPLSRLPRLTDFQRSDAKSLDIRPIAIDDLLGRPQTVLDQDAMRKMIAGRRILITGAGGTIGSELVRQISDYAPTHLTLFDNCEFNLYQIDGQLAERHGKISRSARLGDVRDSGRLASVLARETPDLVFHAAALKHVPMVEENPVEGVLTNAIGTRNVADACQKAGVTAMVMISTDKAVNPTNVMGATKRLAESYCQSLDLAAANCGNGTRFVTVRFGNVLGSTGSVVPLFQNQLRRGGPLTVTHPEISRYFMTVREAVALVLQASVLGTKGKKHGGIFVLDMGKPIFILDLAKQMIRLAGLQPEKDIAIEFTGLRPGEKLHEELFHASEKLVETPCKGILLAAPRTADHEILGRAFNELAGLCQARKSDDVKAFLNKLVPEFKEQKPLPKPALNTVTRESAS
ncbi:polysaccharide biosynthesis protein [Rhodospirillaceae bacterium AH-315-P19]|nr:polysaccharide biosynthesis protein [Rhodospirillaceae bacterium AH-315-P19]